MLFAAQRQLAQQLKVAGQRCLLCFYDKDQLSIADSNLQYSRPTFNFQSKHEGPSKDLTFSLRLCLMHQ